MNCGKEPCQRNKHDISLGSALFAKIKFNNAKQIFKFQPAALEIHNEPSALCSVDLG